MLRGSRDRSTTKNTGSSEVAEHYIKVEHRYNATSFSRTPVSLDPVDDPRAFFHPPRGEAAPPRHARASQPPPRVRLSCRDWPVLAGLDDL